MNEPTILCPVCRIAVPDRLYYQHAREHQRGRARWTALALVCYYTAIGLTCLACSKAPRPRVMKKCARYEMRGVRPGFGFNPFNRMKYQFGVATYGPMTKRICTRWARRPRR